MRGASEGSRIEGRAKYVSAVEPIENEPDRERPIQVRRRIGRVVRGLEEGKKVDDMIEAVGGDAVHEGF